LTFSNAGGTSLTISQAALSGTGFTMGGQSFPVTVPAGQSGSLSLQFAPTVTNDMSGSVSLISDASNSPVQISLSGRGLRHQLSATPGSVSFGNVAVGTTVSQTITLTNSGTAALNISQGTVNGAGFSISGMAFPVSLAPGQSSNLGVQFAPSAVGSMSGSVSLPSNAHNSPTIISLAGSGAQAASGQLSSNPASINFGNVVVASGSVQTVTLTN